MTPQEKARDKRLKKTYDWSLEQVQELDRTQDSKCGICGREAKNMPLNVDHKHFRITAMRVIGGWAATSDIPGTGYQTAKTKAEAVRLARAEALPKSVRGLLCPGRHAGCNRLLGRVDNIKWLKAAIEYLENPPALKVNINRP